MLLCHQVRTDKGTPEVTRGRKATCPECLKATPKVAQDRRVTEVCALTKVRLHAWFFVIEF